MKPTRKLNRRSFLGRVAGGLVFGGALGLIGAEAAAFQRVQTGLTDSDSGSSSDDPGYGRGGANAISDNDPRDPAGQGVNVRNRAQPPQTGVTDRDPTDPRGGGRGGTTGFSDNDRGANADPSGRGHGVVRNGPYSGYSDADRGQIHDAPGHGVGRGAPTGYTGRTDSDPSDAGGYGRGGTSGAATDVRGYRRRSNGECLRHSGTTDADNGAARDPANYGHENGNNVVQRYYCN